MPLDGIQDDNEAKDIVLGLGVLLSWYKEMGLGTIECRGGCQCDPMEISTYLAYGFRV